MLKKIDVDKLLEIIEAETRAEVRFFAGDTDISGCDLVLERAYIADDCLVLNIKKAESEIAIRFSRIASIELEERLKTAILTIKNDEAYEIFFLFAGV
ncbi:hypothetical protein BHF69_07365 [Anaerostipes sp. 992a]|uniref:hypothetical protein n=1 Tax=Anaerostipes sp. 992a TaxID=1261637 RepID=UPI00095143FA|nr:hypothetical protein [Anaerostipes sp. 992a]OLR62516.1 hypothetical protein BHF69_07365 [Anaerostipes sp. 992a]